MSKQRPSQKPPATSSLSKLVPALLLGSVVALLVATPILPSEAVAIEGTHATLNMLWCLLLAGWSLATLGGLVPPLRLSWTLVAAGVLIALHSLSAVVMGGQGGARPALNMLWVWVSYGIAALLLVQLVRTPQQGRAIVAIMIALGICLSMHAAYQYFVSQPALQVAYRANPNKFLEESGISSDPDSQERKHFENRLNSREPLATFALTNSLAGFLAPWLIVAAGIGLGQWRRGGDRSALLAAVAAAVLMAGCLLLTKSRSGILASILGALLILLYARKGGFKVGWKIPVAIGGVLALIGLGVVLAGGLDKEVLSQAPKSMLYRLQYWRSTAAMIADYPFFGCGPGRFQAFFSRYKLPEASESVADPHNFLLEIWATSGTPALLALLATITIFAIELLWSDSRREGEAQSPLSVTKPAQQQSGNNSVTAIYCAAAIGICLGIALAYLAGHNVLSPHTGGTVGLLVLGIPAAIVLLCAMHNWVLKGDLQLSVLVIGLGVLGVNLLAAGAAGFPGVAQSAWVLISISLSFVARPASSNQLRRFNAIALTIFSVLLAVACYWSGYSPVLYSQARLSDSEVPFQSSEKVLDNLAAAAAADPWAAAPLERMAELRLELWLQRKADNQLAEDDLAGFALAAAEYARRELPSFRAAQKRAEWYLRLHARSQNAADLEEALTASREAAARNPSSALVHAELAYHWKLAKDDSAAQMEAEEALRLDKLNPHEEFDLRNHHLQDYRWDAASHRVVRADRPETAEQTMLELRKGLRQVERK